MGFRNSSLVCLTLVLAFSSAIHGLDITKLLSQYPEFAQFNKYLTETKLAEQINGRKTVTILALDDAALSSVSGKSQESVKAILSTHVLLDFYDEKKLMEVVGSKSPMETLFQTSGVAKINQGYVKVDLINEGEIAFGSAVQGSPLNVMLVRSVTTEPNAVSVLQVSQPIVVPGIEEASAKATVASSSGVAQSPVAAAPAPSSSSSSRIHMGFFGAAFAFVSLFFLSN